MQFIKDSSHYKMCVLIFSFLLRTKIKKNRKCCVFIDAELHSQLCLLQDFDVQNEIKKVTCILLRFLLDMLPLLTGVIFKI